MSLARPSASTSRQSGASLMNVYDFTRASQVLVLGEDTGKVTYKGKKSSLLLTEDSLTVFATERNNEPLSQHLTADLLGMSYKASTKPADIATTRYSASAEQIFIVEFYFYPVKTSCCTSTASIMAEKPRYREVLTVSMNCTEAYCQSWWNACQKVIRQERYRKEGEKDMLKKVVDSYREPAASTAPSTPGNSPMTLMHSPMRQAPGFVPQSPNTTLPKFQPRKFLIFINPVSGPGNAQKIFSKVAEPMLKEAGIEVEAVVTTHAGHAKDVLMNHQSLDQLDAVCVIGGDGLLFEVVQGIGMRPDGMKVFQTLALVPIPGGTGNGLSKSILTTSREAFSPVNAVFVAVRGIVASMDLSKLETKAGKVYYSFLSLTWGLISDIDILSEGLRFMGEARVFLAAVYFIGAKRTYTGRIRMKLVDTPTYEDSEFANKIEINKSIDTDDREPDNWISISGEFVMVWIVQTSHVSASVLSGPGKKMDDGVFTVYIVHSGISRFELLSLMLDTDSGKHVFHPKLRCFQCTSYALFPLTKKGIFSLDGESIEYTSVSASILPSAARTFVLPPN